MDFKRRAFRFKRRALLAYLVIAGATAFVSWSGLANASGPATPGRARSAYPLLTRDRLPRSVPNLEPISRSSVVRAVQTSLPF